ncbi:hypothetical protein LUZ60_011322 [Juncus effusus]|nr:hypothetical protein LUZ60_011322 [Juncus effusus]
MADPTSKPYYPTQTPSHLLPPSRSSKTLSSTPESVYWRAFKTSALPSNLILPVNSVTFSPTSPSTLAAASSVSVRLFSRLSGDEQDISASNLSLPDLAYSPSFRCDGALVAAGCEKGVVQVYNMKNSVPLRRLKAHTRASRVVRFPVLHDKLKLFSAGDDAMLVQWDVASESPVFTVPAAHKDYIRAGTASPVSHDIFATGSYDHTVKLWDSRVNSGQSSSLSLTHGSPVESCLFLPSGGLIATAGGNSIKIWDVIGGGKMVHSVETHNKTVTDLSLAKIKDGEMRLLSVSIDGYLKSFDFSRFKVTHSMRYPNQLLSVAFSPDGLFRVVGTNTGTIYMSKKKNKKEERESGAVVTSDFVWNLPQSEKPKDSKNVRYFNQGQISKKSEFAIKKPKRVKLQEHDKLLKKFRHREALASVLKFKNPRSVISVLEELIARKKLIKCLGNLENEELGFLLGFLCKYAMMPQYARFLMGLAKRVIEIHAEEIESSDELKVYMRNLKRMVAQEIMVQKSLQEIQGMISPLLVIAGK